MRVMDKAQIIVRLKERIKETRRNDPEASRKLQFLLEQILHSDDFDYLNPNQD